MVRFACLLAAALCVFGCKEKAEKPVGQGTPGTPSPQEAAFQGGAEASSDPRLSRGHPPQDFVRADTNGRVIAGNGDRIFWVERRAEGTFVRAGLKAGGPAEDVVGPIGSVVAMVATNDILVVAMHQAAGHPTLPTGVIRVELATRTPTPLADEGDAVAVADDTVFILVRGNRERPGKVTRIKGEERKVLLEAPAGLGRADLAIRDGEPFLLGDRRQQGDAGGERTGRLLRVSGTEHTVLSEDIIAPGPHLQVAGDHAYFTARTPGGKRRLHRVPVNGGKPEALLEARWEISRFVVKDEVIYACAHDDKWKLVRFAPNGSAPVVLSTLSGAIVSELIVDDAHVYWGDSGVIRRSPANLQLEPEVKNP